MIDRIDLFVLVADIDAQAVINAILERPFDLGIRPVRFTVTRHPARDNGVARKGADFLRTIVPKDSVDKVLLVWDHHGSGFERSTATESARIVQERLDSNTWLGRSCAVPIEPELEAWLWCDRQSIGNPAPTARLNPKEDLIRMNGGRKLLPARFAELGRKADLKLWEASPSFHTLVTHLRRWFPPKLH